MKITISEDAGLDGFANVLEALAKPRFAVAVTMNDGQVHKGEITGVEYAAGIPALALGDVETGRSLGLLSLNAVEEVQYL